MSDGPYRVEIITPDTARGILEPGDTIIRCPDGSSFMPGAHLCEFWCRNLNEAHAAGAASTPRPAGEAARACVDRLASRPAMLGGLVSPHATDQRFARREAESIILTEFAAALQPPSGTGGQAGDFGEPWHPHFTTHGDPFIVTDPERAAFTQVARFDTSPADYGKSRCERAVACVNALAGMNPAAVQAVIDAAREYIAEWEGAGLGSHRAASKLRDAVHALASLSTGGDAEGGKP